MVNLYKLDTEKINVNTINIDRLSTIDMIKLMNKEDFYVAEAVQKEVGNIAKAVDLIYEKFKIGGRLFYVGSGNSGRLGILDACECVPTFGVDENQVIGILSGGHAAIIHSNEKLEDCEDGALDELKKYNFNKKDIIVGISASGRTPYVKGALKYAKQIEAVSVSLSCSQNAELSKYANIAIEVTTGPEVIAGSTRLKAGTAQKMVLNMLSTGTMIKLGKVYKNYMVDLRPNNNKLIERSKRIIMECTGVEKQKAEQYLNLAENNVKVAIFMLLSGLNKNDSIKILENNESKIYQALKMVQL